jgi:hypothetical protein
VKQTLLSAAGDGREHSERRLEKPPSSLKSPRSQTPAAEALAARCAAVANSKPNTGRSLALHLACRATAEDVRAGRLDGDAAARALFDAAATCGLVGKYSAARIVRRISHDLAHRTKKRRTKNALERGRPPP